LFLGRKLFWLFVAAIGFAAGMVVATRLFDVRPEWIAIVIGLVLGVLGALLAFVVQRVAIGVAGFLAGALIATSLVGALGFEQQLWFWAAALVGGLIGALLLAAVFDWALIGLSSLAGASVIIDALHPERAIAWLGLFILVGIGSAAQISMMRREKQHNSTEESR
jgi:hypothetical protein